MSPSSGARSGTVPSRSQRGAGDGRMSTTTHKLSCGHQTFEAPVSAGPSGKWYRCPEGCGLQKQKGR